MINAGKSHIGKQSRETASPASWGATRRLEFSWKSEGRTERHVKQKLREMKGCEVALPSWGTDPVVTVETVLLTPGELGIKRGGLGSRELCQGLALPFKGQNSEWEGVQCVYVKGSFRRKNQEARGAVSSSQEDQIQIEEQQAKQQKRKEALAGNVPGLRGELSEGGFRRDVTGCPWVV